MSTTPTTDTAGRHIVITTHPFPGETEPQRWIVQPQAYFSVQQGTLGQDYPVTKYLDQYAKLLPEIRLFPVIPGVEIQDKIHPITRGTLPYSPGNPQPPLTPFIHRKRELPEFHFECRMPQMPVRAGYCIPRPAYGQQLTPGQRDALVECFAEELTTALVTLTPEIIKRIRQQVVDKLREQAAEAHEAAQKAEDLASNLAKQYDLA